MRRRSSLVLFLLVAVAALAPAQNVTPLVAPADRILKLRAELRLDSAQSGRLRELGREQSEMLARATSAFLHAEADLVVAVRSTDAGTKRSAMEKRSRAAIDAEMIRLRAEKDARAVLTARQVTLVDILLTESEDASSRARPIWESQVAPLPMNVLPFAVVDSESVRITAVPLTTEIFIGNRSAGFGRVEVRLPVGTHTVKFRSPLCVDTSVVRVEKGPRAMVTHTMSCK